MRTGSVLECVRARRAEQGRERENVRLSVARLVTHQPGKGAPFCGTVPDMNVFLPLYIQSISNDIHHFAT